MNIFKVLASGDGSINEPNVSAFLAYLLNPKEDHGLNDVFLKSILVDLVKKYSQDGLKELIEVNNENEFRLKDLSVRSDFSFEIYTEQAYKNIISEIETKEEVEIFEDEEEDEDDDDNLSITSDKEVVKGLANKKKFNKKQIVDIIIKVYIDEPQGKESKQNQTRKNIATILIENKIAKNSGKGSEEQLKFQYLYSHATLREQEDKNDDIYTIYITPNKPNYLAEFESFLSNSPYSYSYKDSLNKEKIKCQTKGVPLYWRTLRESNENSNSIEKVFSDILKSDIEGSIEPLQNYTIHTLKAFYNFIKTDFKNSLNAFGDGKKEFIEENNFEERLKKQDQKLQKWIKNLIQTLGHFKKPYSIKYSYKVKGAKGFSFYKEEKKGVILRVEILRKKLQIRYKGKIPKYSSDKSLTAKNKWQHEVDIEYNDQQKEEIINLYKHSLQFENLL